MDWEDKKVLVTGAAGFIGSHLVEELVQLGANVRAFVRYNSRNEYGYLNLTPSYVRDKLEIFPGDLLSADAAHLSMEGIDLVFHLASIVDTSPYYVTPKMVIENNVVSLTNLIDSAKQSGIKNFIHISSWEVYGNAQNYPTPEDEPIRVCSTYSASKVCCEKIIEAYHCLFDIPYIIIRPFSTYGPRQNLRAIIPTIILQILKQKEVYLGKMDIFRDFIFVKDTVHGIIKIAETPQMSGHIVNLGSGEETKIEELVVNTASLLRKKIEIIFDPLRIRTSTEDISRSYSDITKLKELTGWEPEFSLEEGIKTTAGWISSLPSLIS